MTDGRYGTCTCPECCEQWGRCPDATEAASWSPEDYYRASRHANRAWLATQPQYVIEGVLEAADSGTTSSGGVGSLERVPKTSPVHRDALDTPKETP